MRILPIALSVLMIFMPAYSAYASMLPTKGQIVQIGKKGGALIKTGAGKLVKGGVIAVGYEGGKAVWAWCKNNQKKCKDKIGDAYDVICDLTSCDVERKEDEGDGYCYTAGAGKQSSPDEACRQSYQFDPNVQFISDTSEQYTSNNPNHVGYCEGTYPGWTFKVNIGTVSKVPCDDKPKEKRPLTDDELNDLAKKIADKMDDDDIKNYYNTKYDDIIINNNHYYGDEINRETNIDNKCQNNSCNEISKEIEKDIKKKKYDIDDVTPANCTMEENTGKYIACNMKIENEEDNSNKEGDTTNKDTNVTKKEDEEEPHFCKTSDLTKEACEFFDWVDDEPSEKQDKKVNIEDEDEEKLDRNKINLNEGCPADQHISVSMPWGYSTTIEITYKPYCDFARDLKPYMTATGAIVSMYIVGSCGRRL